MRNGKLVRKSVQFNSVLGCRGANRRDTSGANKCHVLHYQWWRIASSSDLRGDLWCDPHAYGCWLSPCGDVFLACRLDRITVPAIRRSLVVAQHYCWMCF
jgi:hypothetical protein